MAVRFSRRFYPYIYRWTEDAESLLPSHYKQRCLEFMRKDPTPVHWRFDPRKYKPCEKTGQKTRVQNTPVIVKYPYQCNQGLWGGEGFVTGMVKHKPKGQRFPKIWRPFLQKRVLYSEILDKYFAITVTLRALDLIDQHMGLDNYILKTHEVDLCSKLGMDLKRDMLMALATKSCYPNNANKQQEILTKYKDFIMPVEEIEWIGLSIEEALEKARKEKAAREPPVPLKEVFMAELAEQMSKTEIKEGASGFMSKLNPFAKKTEEKRT